MNWSFLFWFQNVDIIWNDEILLLYYYDIKWAWFDNF